MGDKNDRRKRKSIKLGAVLCSLIFSIVLMIFPVVSGVIIVINGIDTLQSYCIQGAFMMISIAVPVIFMRVTKMKPAQIGFTGVKKGSIKIVLYFVPIIAAKVGFFFYAIKHDIHTTCGPNYLVSVKICYEYNAELINSNLKGGIV